MFRFNSDYEGNRFARLSRLIVAFLVMVVVLICEPSNADVVVNGTFDDNVTGWTGTFVAQSGDGSKPDLDTESYFFAGSNASNQITQSYDLTAAEVNELTSSGLGYEMSADLFGFWTQSDWATFSVEFFDGVGASGTSLGLVSLAGVNPGTWGDSLTAGTGDNYFSTFGNVDPLTQSLLISVSSTRVNGANNDGYADNVSFSLTSVPEPSASLALIMLGLATVCRRTRLS